MANLDNSIKSTTWEVWMLANVKKRGELVADETVGRNEYSTAVHPRPHGSMSIAAAEREFANRSERRVAGVTVQ